MIPRSRDARVGGTHETLWGRVVPRIRGVKSLFMVKVFLRLCDFATLENVL